MDIMLEYFCLQNKYFLLVVYVYHIARLYMPETVYQVILKQGRPNFFGQKATIVTEDSFAGHK